MFSFFAMMSRMKYINRWALMRSSREEDVSEHSLEVSMIAHGLAIISKERYSIDVDEARVALKGIYHDASEIITGDMPTPVKYYDDDIRASYKRVENIACHTLMNKLPADMKKYYHPLLFGEEDALEFLDKVEEDAPLDVDTLNSDKKALDAYEWRLVKAADKLSALIKCIEERKSGNTEFESAYTSTEAALQAMDIPAVEDFLNDFLPAYELTLDELQGR
ncbi:MAG: 5'-deoxynucleotidase [Eubacterium sp.]|nr:5'-deoxynucleotidase [Eubacterium sp.]MBR0119524.1 5'-deoxynucleotidase [Eubacterium sp.]